jgi:ABC-type sulfate/molybdate transport systems ATPase subunit
MIYVTHSPDEVTALCDDVLVLARGHIEQRGSPAELFIRSPTPHFVLRPTVPEGQ